VGHYVIMQDAPAGHIHFPSQHEHGVLSHTTLSHSSFRVAQFDSIVGYALLVYGDTGLSSNCKVPPTD
jgi:hypothetical protein